VHGLCTVGARLPIQVISLSQRLCTMCTVCAVLEATPRDEGPGAQTGAETRVGWASSYPFLFSLSKHAQRAQRAQPLCRSGFFVRVVHGVRGVALDDPPPPREHARSNGLVGTIATVFAHVRLRPAQPLHLFKF
jgi:hypothetical protein